MEFLRPTWVEIDLGALAHNLKEIKRKVGDQVKVMAVIKADAYGHGAIAVAKVAQKMKIDYLGVATLIEGIELRKTGVTLPILVLDPILLSEAPNVIEYDLTQTVCDRALAMELSKMGKKYNKKVKIHIEIDTGMGRSNLLPGSVPTYIVELLSLPNLKIEGVFTHFPLADEGDEDFTRGQIFKFKEIVERLEDRQGIKIPFKHTANTAAILSFSESYFNMVRPGAAIYGVYPSTRVNKSIDLEPVLTLKTTVTYLKSVPAGTYISYGRTYTTKKKTIIATLPVGYADGYSRLLSNLGQVIVRGEFAPVVGRVCMKQTMVEIGDIPGVRIGDEVILIGKNKRKEISVEDIARKIGTIPEEVLCMISKKLPCIYR